MINDRSVDSAAAILDTAIARSSGRIEAIRGAAEAWPLVNIAPSKSRSAICAAG